MPEYTVDVSAEVVAQFNVDADNEREARDRAREMFHEETCEHVIKFTGFVVALNRESK